MLQVAKMHKARTADLSCKDLGDKRMLNKPFFDPAVCEKTPMRLDMNL